MRSTLKVSILATALFALGACMEDSDIKDETPTNTELKQPAATDHHGGKWKHRKHHKDPAAHAKLLGEKLGLSADQQSKAEAIFKQDIPWSERHTKIKEILTPEQQTKLAELKAKHGHHGKWDPAKKAKRHAEKLKTKLGLSDDQATKIEAIFKSGVSRDERHKQINALLSADQQKKLAELKAKHPHHGKWKHGKFDPAKKIAWMQEKLGLTADQKTRLEAAFKTGTWKERKQLMKTILTADQLAELKRLRKRKHHGKGMHGKGMHHKGMHP